MCTKLVTCLFCRITKSVLAWGGKRESINRGQISVSLALLKIKHTMIECIKSNIHNWSPTMTSTSNTTGVWEPMCSQNLKRVPPSLCTPHCPEEGAQTPDTEGTESLVRHA